MATASGPTPANCFRYQSTPRFDSAFPAKNSGALNVGMYTCGWARR